MSFMFLNIGLRAVLTLCTVYLIVKFGQRLNFKERLGTGIIGGSSIMTIPLIIDVHKDGTPFDGWATSLITIGFIFAFLGLRDRFRDHERRNADAKEQAAHYLNERGRL